MPRGQAPKTLVIELVPAGVRRNAACKGCGVELRANGYRYKPSKAASWHPWCYEDARAFVPAYMRGATSLDITNLDLEARERIEGWAAALRAVDTAREATREVAVGRKRAREEAPNAFDADEPASMVVQAEDGTPYKFSYAVTQVGPGDRGFDRSPAAPRNVNPLGFLRAVRASDDAPVVIPEHPTRICDILHEMEKKTRTICGVAAMKMFMC